MRIAIADEEELAPRHFAVCEFYGVETCFCWNSDKLVIFPYTRDESAMRDVQALSTPAPLRRIKFFGDRAFLICTPWIYKLSRNGEFALLSTNALDMGAEFFQVFTCSANGIYLDDKKIKFSKQLFSVPPNATEEVRSFPLILKDTETRFVNCFTVSWEVEKNLCIIAHARRLFILRRDILRLLHTTDDIIMNIVPVKRQGKVAGLLLLVNMNTVTLVHGKDYRLVYEKIHLRENVRNISALCAGFSMQVENVVWIVYCDQSKTYYVRKELFADAIQVTRIEERTFSCIQHYKPNVILGLSRNELVELSVEELENSLVINNNVNLHTSMFHIIDLIMEKICAKVKELDMLYERLIDEQDKLKRINLYASKQKLQISPCIEVSKVRNYYYLTLSIFEKLPKNSHLVFSLASKNRNTFCMKEVTETEFSAKMPINKNAILYSSTINIDLITFVNEQHPWCLIQNFIYCPPQNIKRKRGPKKDKTAFINAKIVSLQNLIADRKNLSMVKLSEIKKIIRKEL